MINHIPYKTMECDYLSMLPKWVPDRWNIVGCAVEQVDGKQRHSHTETALNKAIRFIPKGKYRVKPRRISLHIEAKAKWTPFFRRHFQLDFWIENVWISLQISLTFVHKGPVNNSPALVQMIYRRRPGDKSMPKRMMVRVLTHIWVNHEKKSASRNHMACTICPNIFSPGCSLCFLW